MLKLINSVMVRLVNSKKPSFDEVNKQIKLLAKNNSKYVLKDWNVNTIRSYFNFPELYIDRVLTAKPNAKFVEIGTYEGRSALFMGKMIKILNRNDIDFYAIDNDSRIYPVFKRYIDKFELKDYIIPIKGDSTIVAKTFGDRTLDFVFIDAEHDFINVDNDIKAWLPKVKIGGIISGHDYLLNIYPGLVAAVYKHFGNTIQLSNSCWIKEVNE